MKTWYKDINWKEICVWDTFQYTNKKFTWQNTVEERNWQFYWRVFRNWYWDWWDKFVPLQKFLKHWVKIIKTKEESEKEAEQMNYNYDMHLIEKLENEIKEKQAQLKALKEKHNL